jgi:biopolymer transport protein ExbD
VTAQGKILHDGREVNLAEVTAIVKGGLDDPETPVVIRVSEKARQGLFVAVWDAAKRGGARTLSFNTVQ